MNDIVIGPRERIDGLIEDSKKLVVNEITSRIVLGQNFLEIRGICDTRYAELGYANPNKAFNSELKSLLRCHGSEEISSKSAYEYMQIAKNYADNQEALEHFGFSALRLLAAPKADKCRDKVYAELISKESVSKSDVQEAINRYVPSNERTPITYEKAEVKIEKFVADLLRDLNGNDVKSLLNHALAELK